MTRTSALALIAAALLIVPSTASAASKEQQLLMAELRIMQQNQQMLQQSLITLAETLKSVTGRLDEQAGASRKALADQRLLIEGMTDTVRALREKSDDTNVRLSSITQELESIRQTMASAPAPAPVAVAPPPTDPAADPAAAGLTPSPPPSAAPTVATPPPGISPQRTYDSAYSDYAAGQYDLAIVGFQTFLKFFPRHMSADDAQLNIGNSLYNGGKYREAVTEYQRVISDYAGTDSVPAAHYKLGQTYMALKQNDLARKQFETLMQAFPRSNEATLAKQALDRLGK
jgi:tol-pal system protein YbgF